MTPFRPFLTYFFIFVISAPGGHSVYVAAGVVYSIGKMGWAIPNVALSATLYIAFRLRDPARLCSRESLNSCDAHQLYTTLNLCSSTKQIYTDRQNNWCFFNVLLYENLPRISNKTANINVKNCSLYKC